MRKIFSFFALLVYIIIVFFHNPIMSFAMQDNNMVSEMGMNQIDYCESDWKTDKIPNSNCCYESDSAVLTSALNNFQNDNKAIKIKVNKCLDIFTFSINAFENKKLIKNTSPPFIEKKIKYYSYKDLIKIIKSNT